MGSLARRQNYIWIIIIIIIIIIIKNCHASMKTLSHPLPQTDELVPREIITPSVCTRTLVHLPQIPMLLWANIETRELIREAMGWTMEGSELESRQSLEFSSRPPDHAGSRLTQPPIQWVPRTAPQLVPTSKNVDLYIHTPYVFMA
jgi:hypothetical protein